MKKQKKDSGYIITFLIFILIFYISPILISIFEEKIF